MELSPWRSPPGRRGDQGFEVPKLVIADSSCRDGEIAVILMGGNAKADNAPRNVGTSATTVSKRSLVGNFFDVDRPSPSSSDRRHDRDGLLRRPRAVTLT
jgi:hypothetical protein